VRRPRSIFFRDGAGCARSADPPTVNPRGTGTRPYGSSPPANCAAQSPMVHSPIVRSARRRRQNPSISPRPPSVVMVRRLLCGLGAGRLPPFAVSKREPAPLARLRRFIVLITKAFFVMKGPAGTWCQLVCDAKCARLQNEGLRSPGPAS